ncbi:MAG: bL9 family ribosomal protein [Patescibacteria group bacterium]|nr:bL9 family ribosomal protein [Patescibacteria group bacterium]
MAKKNVKFVEVILKENVEKLGQKGEVKIVRLGYFSNFLLPKNFAIIATANAKEKQAELIEKKKVVKTTKKQVKAKKEIIRQKKKKEKEKNLQKNKK